MQWTRHKALSNRDKHTLCCTAHRLTEDCKRIAQLVATAVHTTTAQPMAAAEQRKTAGALTTSGTSLPKQQQAAGQRAAPDMVLAPTQTGMQGQVMGITGILVKMVMVGVELLTTRMVPGRLLAVVGTTSGTKASMKMNVIATSPMQILIGATSALSTLSSDRTSAHWLIGDQGVANCTLEHHSRVCSRIGVRHRLSIVVLCCA